MSKLVDFSLLPTRGAVSLIATLLLLLASFQQPSRAAQASAIAHTPGAVSQYGRSQRSALTSEGPVISGEITAGPFDLHRKYLSMQGPYIVEKIRLADLFASKRVAIPESKIMYVERGPAPLMVQSSPAVTEQANSVKSTDTSTPKRELYWFKGVKLEVLDEQDQKLPSAEFICHSMIEVDRQFRKSVFSDQQKGGLPRIVTLTQGQTEFLLPEGFGVPAASDETWAFTFQAANRTTNEHRRVKHLCTVYFVKDSELKRPMKALTWYCPYIAVSVDRKSSSTREAAPEGMSDCLGMSSGEHAPNIAPASIYKDSSGRQISAHWVVPPGTHSYQAPLTEGRDQGLLAADRQIHAVWSHVHPYCSTASLVSCAGRTQTNIFSTQVSTKPGPEILRISSISSEKGIPLPSGRHYLLKATYNNITNQAQDSMVIFGVFVEDNHFKRPEWNNLQESANCRLPEVPMMLTQVGEAPFCGIKGDTTASESAKQSREESEFQYPLFDEATDGPVLSEAKQMEIISTAGKIHVILDPGLAPKTATQLYKLLKAGIFNGTSVYRYEPNYVLQTTSAEVKVDTKFLLSSQARSQLRHLPLETSKEAMPKKWSLIMAHGDDINSAVSSFSILLADAPHLDQKYTIFGRLVPDNVTVHTIEQIIQHWSDKQAWIVDADELKASTAEASLISPK